MGRHNENDLAMKLLYKDDWEEAEERYRLWWNREYFGRCAMWVTAPRDNAPPLSPPPEPADPQNKWTDLKYLFAACEYSLSRTFFGGEAFPIWEYGYPGRENIGVFLGCNVALMPTTGWLDPILEDERLEVRHLRISEDNRWWRFTLGAHEMAASMAKGKAIPTTGAFGGVGDSLAWLRGTERLLIDCVEQPDRVRDAEEYLLDVWIEVFERLHGILSESRNGSGGWFPLWAPGRFYAIQNDFSFNVGPDMFREIFLPVIRRHTEFLDQSIYHVDGVDAFRHVDALLELPRLGALQILPGEGKPSPLKYMPVLKKVQTAGRNLHIMIPPDEVRDALDNLSARGLFIHTWTETESEARNLLKNAEKWSHDRG